MDYILNGSIKMPMQYYIAAVLIGVAAGAICYYKQQPKFIPTGILDAYVFLVLSSTVFSRDRQADYNFELTPFWSYVAVYHGNKELLIEDIANVAMLIPVGILVAVIWRTGLKRTMLIGFGLSLFIELLQLLLKCGLFELDDIIHNTLGCLIGYGIYVLICRIMLRIRGCGTD